jgi:hypothetical protein
VSTSEEDIDKAVDAVQMAITMLKPVFMKGTTLTFIMRMPGDDTNVMILSDDESLFEVARLLERYATGKMQSRRIET